MVKQYNIIKAEKSSGEDNYGNETFWLTIEGYPNESIRCLRKPSSPWLSGPTWGEITEATSKAGKPYKKFKVMPAPEAQSHTNEPHQFKADPDKQASIEWQSAIKAGVEAVRDFYTFGTATSPNPVVSTLEDYKKDIVNTAITFARVVDVQPSTLIERDEPEDEVNDEPPLELYDAPTINLDDIPF